ncbi:MAG: enolase C-terminal domain-like protein [Pseudomonadales bacterium]
MVDSYLTVETVVERVGTIRDNFSSSVDFRLDFQGRFSVPMAKVLLSELECFHPLFVEEPVLPEHAEQYLILCQKTSIVLAAGESMYSRFDFKKVFETCGLSIVQPDLSDATTISPLIQFASRCANFSFI